LPDSVFSCQKTPFLYILEGLEMENFGAFHSHLLFYVIAIFEYFIAI
jgi:hypothetical protein